MELIIYIYYSNLKEFKKNSYYKIITKSKIGEGSYGFVYEINPSVVLKIFKYQTIINKNSQKLIPYKNENRELDFFMSYIKYHSNQKSPIIKIKAIGLIKSSNIKQAEYNDHYCLFLPYCVPISKLLYQYKMPLINLNHGKLLTLEFMKKLLEIELYLNNELNITNLDIKLNNFMIEKDKELKIDNIIGIDFGLIKKRNNEKYFFETKYFIWPHKKELKLDYLPSYSVCINGLILLFGKNENVSLNNTKYYLEHLKDDNDYYKIFFNGLLLKIKTKDLFELINKYIKKHNIKH
jgi:hypothetical protein